MAGSRRKRERKESYETLAADIENSNPGVYIAAKPIWAGRLHKLKERRVNNAGLILVVERTNEINNMLRSNNPRMVVMGRHRMCRLWREDHPAAVCRKCQQIGHSQEECRNEAVCSFCRKNHETRNHVCPVTTCKKKGMVCEHVSRMCFSCNEEGHWTGDKNCPAIKEDTNTQSSIGATPIRGDNTSITGVTDNSKNRINRQYKGGNGDSITETMIEKGVSAKNINTITAEVERNRRKLTGEVRLTRSERNVATMVRSSSTPATARSNKENEIPSRW